MPLGLGVGSLGLRKCAVGFRCYQRHLHCGQQGHGFLGMNTGSAPVLCWIVSPEDSLPYFGDKTFKMVIKLKNGVISVGPNPVC